MRLASIPHRDALLAQGQSLSVDGGPRIEPADSTPVTHSTGGPVTGPAYLAPFKDTALPPGIPAEAVTDPNVLLTDAIKDQRITRTVVLPVSTTGQAGGSAGGIQNIPFVVANANATSMSAIFWIERVEHPELGEFLQLQYTQTIILNFPGID